MKAISKIELALLYDTYGMLLTDRQQHIISSYCNYDCSLSEISEQTGISRQAVHDSIVSAEHNLLHYEQSLALVADRQLLTTARQELASGNYNEALALLDRLLEE